jgi:tRNA1(Val) A37 N6-methylase TrmN6
MILEFNAELSRQEIHAHGDELASLMGMDRDEEGRRIHSHPRSRKMKVATLKDPVLVTDAHRIGELGTDNPVLRDTVFALYGSSHRTTLYDDVSLEFEQDKYPGVWGPSIDTLFFCRALRALEISERSVAVEIGCGSGFIGKYLLEKFDALDSVSFVDMNPMAVACAKACTQDERARFFAGDGLAFLDGHPADLVVCNPPYIPRPKSIDDNAYEGVHLLVQLIERAQTYLRPGGRLLLNLSSLSLNIARQAMDRVSAQGVELASMEVPLKVFNVLNNAQWRQYLVEHHGLAEGLRQGYRHWHTLHLMEIRPHWR